MHLLYIKRTQHFHKFDPNNKSFEKYLRIALLQIYQIKQSSEVNYPNAIQRFGKRSNIYRKENLLSNYIVLVSKRHVVEFILQ